MLTGKSNEVATETLGLDLFVKSTVAEETEGFGGNPTANDLHLAAQNMQGLFWLYPADEFGPWLQVIPSAGLPGRLLQELADPRLGRLAGCQSAH